MDIEINSLEDMCSLMCDNRIPEKNWYFTFGCGQPNAGYYVKIKGTYDSARQKMFDRYGEDWGFQYSEEEWKSLKHHEKRLKESL